MVESTTLKFAAFVDVCHDCRRWCGCCLEGAIHAVAPVVGGVHVVDETLKIA